MDRLWTPWRLEYVSSGSSVEGCFLCQKVEEQQDEDNLILYRGELGFIVLNLYPYNTGHLMVAPYVHTGDLANLDAQIGCALWNLTQQATRALTEEYHPEGFNIGMNVGRSGGAGLPDHLHIHVVPRWQGDTNFMPVTADTKVLPEALTQTYRRLKPYFAS